MRIVIDAREYTTSTGRYVFRLVQYLEKIDQGHDYVILLKPEDMDKCRLTNPRFSKVACPYKEFTFGEQLGLAWQLYRLKADLVHFGMTHQPILYFKKSVTTIHDLTTLRFRNPAKNPVVFYLKQLVYRGVVRYAAHKSKHLLMPTEFVKKDVLRYCHVRPEKISVTYEAADTIREDGEAVPGLKPQPFIMYVGRPLPHKNLDRLVEAFQLLKHDHPALQLVLAGKRDILYARIVQRLEAAGIRDVIVTGYVSEGQLRWLYEHCQVYAFPSLSEGFGLPGLEAMAHGAPMASSNASCLPEVYGDAAHYFNPFDVSDMARAISDVLDDAALRQQLIVNGKAQAHKYSWRRMAEQTLAVYDAVLQ